MNCSHTDGQVIDFHSLVITFQLFGGLTNAFQVLIFAGNSGIEYRF